MEARPRIERPRATRHHLRCDGCSTLWTSALSRSLMDGDGACLRCGDSLRAVAPVRRWSTGPAAIRDAWRVLAA